MNDHESKPLVDLPGYNTDATANSKELFLGLGITLAGIVALTLGVFSYFAFEDLISLNAKQTRFAELNGEIGRLDEVLTMSARMGAATGDSKWEERYRENEPILGAAINRILEQFPELSVAKETDLANQKLVELEQQSFALAKINQKSDAFALLVGEEYQNQKKIYSLGMSESNNILQQKLVEKTTAVESKSKSVGLAALVFMILTLIGWVGLSKRLRLKNHNLREFSFTLEERVKVLAIQLVQKSKLASLGEMAGGIAHEINNPLAIVKVKASQLRRLIVSGQFDQAQTIDFLQSIEDTVARMSTVIDGLRTFSRSNNLEIKNKVPLKKILNDVLGLCEERIKTCGVALELGEIADIQLNCRVVQIEQVLINLVNNSFDAVKGTKGAWIKVEAKCKSKAVEISVTDSGEGISEEVAEKIMEPFFTTKQSKRCVRWFSVFKGL